MILYQVVRWMNERNRIKSLIHHVDGDVQFLHNKRKKLDEDMVNQLQQWTKAPGPKFVMDLNVIEPPSIDKEITLIQ